MKHHTQTNTHMRTHTHTHTYTHIVIANVIAIVIEQFVSAAQTFRGALESGPKIVLPHINTIGSESESSFIK